MRSLLLNASKQPGPRFGVVSHPTVPQTWGIFLVSKKHMPYLLVAPIPRFNYPQIICNLSGAEGSLIFSLVGIFKGWFCTELSSVEYLTIERTPEVLYDRFTWLPTFKLPPLAVPLISIWSAANTQWHRLPQSLEKFQLAISILCQRDRTVISWQLATLADSDLISW